MRSSRSINAELQTAKRHTPENLYTRSQTIIQKQQELIHSLQNEVLLLKSYISLEKNSPFDHNCTSEISLNSTSSSNESQLRPEPDDNPPCLHKQLLNRIAEALEMADWDPSNEEVLVQGILAIQNRLKSQEPVFIERVKEKRVPVIIEKEVEVQKIVEKIVYVERGPEERDNRNGKVGEKEKRSEKYQQSRRAGEEYEKTLNKTFSQRHLRPRREEETYYEYQEERPRYDHFKKDYRGDYPNTMVKRRGEYSKPYPKKY